MTRVAWLCVCLLAAGLDLSAQSAAVAPRTAPPAGMRPYLLAISVRNLDRSVAWYRDVLGFRQTERMNFANDGIAVALLDANGFRLELVEKRGSVAPSLCTDVSNPAQLLGMGKLAFMVDDAASLERDLKARGTTFVVDLRDDPKHGQRAFIVKDNDGNWIEFFEQTGRAKESAAAGSASAFVIDAPDSQFFAASVHDLDKSVVWYHRALGFREARRSSFAGGRVAIMTAGGATLELLEVSPPAASVEKLIRPGAGRWTVQGLFKAGLYVNNLDALAANLNAEKIATDGGIRKDENDNGRRFVLVKDAEGNELQIFERQPAGGRDPR